jgi:hypothetical protein
MSSTGVVERDICTIRQSKEKKKKKTERCEGVQCEGEVTRLGSNSYLSARTIDE